MAVGIASTGVLTFTYFSVASHLLGAAAAARLDVLWSVMFVVISVIYRPIEQLLSRSIAEHRALDQRPQGLRHALAIQGAFALAFLAIALALEGEIRVHLLGGSQALYLILLTGTLAYAASYFARGYLAGHERYAHYGALVFIESFSRLCFALAVAIGIASGADAVALGIAAAPFFSLLVLAPALLRAQARRGQRPTASERTGALTLRSGARFAGAVSVIMAAEQTLLNGAVLTVAATSHRAALPGIVFNVFLIARAPLQLFQAIQTTLLPHLTGLAVREGRQAFARAVALTVRLIAALAALLALLLALAGPPLLDHALFGQRYSYDRFGLALVALGLGMHLIAGTFNQAALARSQARAAAWCWVAGAVLFIAWMLAPVLPDELLRAEVGYTAAATLLALMLSVLYRRGASAPVLASAAASSR